MEVSDEAVFENVGQAVHVSFLIMAQEATQDAPLRKALMRAMETIQLSPNQQHWLDALRGVGGGTVNFGGLDHNEVRAQCAFVTQAVKSRLPKPEMWVLQAKFGQTEFEDVVDSADAFHKLAEALELAEAAVRKKRVILDKAQVVYAKWSGTITRDDADRRKRGEEHRAVLELREQVAQLESDARLIQIAVGQTRACKLVDNGRRVQVGLAPRRRYVFSAERITAIQGLSEWLRPLLPTVPALAIDCMLGRMFANHKKIDITFRELAESFGGSHVKYYRASKKMISHVRTLEHKAMARLEPIFEAQGVTKIFEESV